MLKFAYQQVVIKYFIEQLIIIAFFCDSPCILLVT